MSNGNDEQTNPTGLGNIREPKVEQPNGDLNPNTKNVDVLTDTLPELKGQNSYNVKKRLLDDNDLFEKVSRKYFVSSVGGDKLRQMEEDVFKKTYEHFKKNFRKDLVDSSYQGKTTDESLVDRSIEITDSFDEVDANRFASVIKNNPKKYQDTGIIDEKGNFVYEGEQAAFKNYLTNNRELFKEIEKDRYSSFTEELEKHHNRVEALDNPATKTKAWVIYDKQGPEGLTNFINGLQNETEDEPFDENKYLRNTQVGDKSLAQYYSKFVAGEVEDTEYGLDIAETAYDYGIEPTLLAGLVETESSFNPNAVSSTGAVGLTQLQPATASELGLKVPEKLVELDRKRINSTGKQRDKYEQELEKFTKELPKDPEEDQRYDPQLALRATGKYLSKSSQKFKDDEDRAIGSYYAGVRGAEQMETLEGDTLDYVNRVKNNATNYSDSVDRGLTFRPKTKRKDITENIPKDTNAYSAPFYQKGGDKKELREYIPEFVKSYIPQNRSKNFDMDRFFKEGDYSSEVKEIADKTYDLAQDGNKFSFDDLANTLFANSQTTGKNQFGNRYYEIDYKKLPWHAKNAYNTLQQNPDYADLFESKGDGVYHFIPNRKEGVKKAAEKVRNYFYDTTREVVYNDDGTVETREVPDKGGIAQTWNSFVNLTFGGGHHAVKYMVDPLMQGLNNITGGDVDWIRESAEATEEYAGISLSELSTADEDGWVPNAVEEVGPTFWYLANMMNFGNLGRQAIGKGMQLFSRTKGGIDAMRMGKVLKGSDNLSKIGKGLQQTTNKTLDFYIGGAAMESLTPQDDSFYNIMPELVGKEDNPVTNFYNKSDGWVRTGMDMGASLMLDFGIDSFIGAARYGKDNVMKQFFDKEKFTSTEYVREVTDEGRVSGYYRSVDTPQFTHEITRFKNDLMNEVADREMGSVGETMAKSLTPQDNPETIHDMVYQFTEKTSPFISSLKKDIESTVRNYEKEFGGGIRLSQDQVDELVEANYKRFIDSSADNLYKFLKEGDGVTDKFVRALEEQQTQTKQFKIGGRKIPPREASRWLDKGYNLVVKGDNVYEVDPQFWTTDLASAIRKRRIDDNIESVANRKIKEAGIDPEDIGKRQDEYERIKQQTRQTIGTPVNTSKGIGYVSDFDDAGYTVRTAEGDVRVDSIQQSLTEDEIKENFVKGWSQNFVKKRMERGLFGFESQPKGLLGTRLPSKPDVNMKGVRQRAEQVETAGRPMLENLARSPQRRLTGRVLGTEGDERAILEQIEQTEFKIQDLQRRHERLDEIVDTSGQLGKTDEGQRVGNMRRDITRRVKELRKQKEDLQTELSRFYLDNPQIQKQRTSQYVNQKRFEQIDREAIQRTRQQLDDFANKLESLSKSSDKLPFC